MKKLMLGLAIAFGGLTANMTLATTPTFSPVAMRQHSVDSLRFSDIIHELYSGQTSEPYVEDDSINALPHTKLGVDDNGLQIIGAMHPVIAYQNAAGEPRYLVIIEKVKVYEDSGNLVECHACQAAADLYSFKPLEDGSFQLVSKSQQHDIFSSSWGRLQLDESKIIEGMQPLGSNLVGSILENGVSSTGSSENWWDVLHLPEDNFIKLYSLGDAGGDNSGQYGGDSPLSYYYTATYQVMPNNAKYYPIIKKFEGDKPTEDYERIVPVNYSEVLRFDEAEQDYK